jgi:hypothetical protein
MDNMGAICSTHERCEKCIQKLDGKPQEKLSFWRPRSRWEDYSEIVLKEKNEGTGLVYFRTG